MNSAFRKDFNWEERFVKKTKIDRYIISTVDLGINHQFLKGLPPLYYETMIFDSEDEDNNYFKDYQERYSTEQQAIRGHEETIELVKSFLGGKDEAI